MERNGKSGKQHNYSQHTWPNIQKPGNDCHSHSAPEYHLAQYRLRLQRCNAVVAHPPSFLEFCLKIIVHHLAFVTQ